MRAPTPGQIGWIAVGAVVAAADGYALTRKEQTMSDVFTSNYGWGVFLACGVAAHLLTHRVTRVAH